MRVYYQLTTVDPVIVSVNNASANNHGSLDYIPGSAILGALAAEHYPHLTPEESWNAFHSGHVRFSPVYPVINNQLCLPVPASWHYEKGKNAISNDHFNSKIISNHACNTFNRDSEANTNKQFKQCRDGYFNSTRDSAKVTQSVATKTAIDSKIGKAKEGQLFSYAHIDAGQKFSGWIESSDQNLFDKFKQSLQGTMRIGRSRNSEFGRVKVQIIKASSPPDPIKTDPKTLVLWCLSDCEMLNEMGLATFTPELSSINNKLQGTLNRQLSFIRSSRISRFNQKRMGLDSEQLLITKGSVLVYDLHTAADAEVLKDLRNNGMGRNRQQGLGWIDVNPHWAFIPELSDKALFSAVTLEIKENDKGKPQGRPKNYKGKNTDSSLTRWLNDKIKAEEDLETRTQEVNVLLKKIIYAYSNARSYNNIYPSNEAGPSSHQWQRISDRVRNNNSPNWIQGVFDGDNAICKAKNDELGWGIQWSEGNNLTSFADFIRSTLNTTELLTMRSLLDKLCRYDLSTAKDLKTIKQELKIDAAKDKENNKQEVTQ